MKRALIVDLDNTLYDFDSYFAYSTRALVHALRRATGVPEIMLENDIRAIIAAHGTLEYPFLIQELQSVRDLNLSDDHMARLVRIGRGAFKRTRDKRLLLYPGVRETLKWAQSEGIIIIALSNAPAFQAEARLRHFHLSGYFRALYSWEGYTVPSFAKNLTRSYTSKIPLERISADKRKPNPTPLLCIIERYSLSLNTTYLVGDSIEKDIRLAQNVGIRSIWARYGTIIDKETAETLIKFSPNERQSLEHEKKLRQAVCPDHTIDRFDEISNILSIQARLL